MEFSTKTKNLSKIWLVIPALFLIVLFLGGRIKTIKQSVTNWRLRPYEQQIKDCWEKEKKEREKIEEDRCILQVASALYAKKQELGIKLCIQHGPSDADIDENVGRAACKAGIERYVMTSHIFTGTEKPTGQ